MTTAIIASRRRTPRTRTNNPAALLTNEWRTATEIGLAPSTLFAMVRYGDAELLPALKCYLFRRKAQR